MGREVFSVKFPKKDDPNFAVCISLLTFAAREPPSLLTMLKSGVVLFLYSNDNQFPETIQQPGGLDRIAIPKRACFR